MTQPCPCASSEASFINLFYHQTYCHSWLLSARLSVCKKGSIVARDLPLESRFEWTGKSKNHVPVIEIVSHRHKAMYQRQLLVTQNDQTSAINASNAF